MPITERTLRKWRGEALKDINYPDRSIDPDSIVEELSQRILRMTQELLDQHLIRKI